ncbi:hypothetical protein DMUE_5390, partial [Dictyocoela muelleri]
MFKKSLHKIKIIDDFRSEIEEIGNFFQKSAKLKLKLKSYTSKNIPRSIKTRWNYHARLFNSVSESLACLIEYLKAISSDKEFKLSVRLKAKHFFEFLGDKRNNILITIFVKIFNSVSKVFEI